MNRTLSFEQFGYVLISFIMCFTFLACSDRNTDSTVSALDTSYEIDIDSNDEENLLESATESDSISDTVIPTEVSNSEFTETNKNTSNVADSIQQDSVDGSISEIVTPFTGIDLDHEPLYGGTLKFSSEYTDYDLSYQNVHLQFSPTLSSFGPGVIYSRVLKFNTGPEVIQPSLEIECDVCESWKMISPTRFQFKLKEGVQWHKLENGATDVLKSRHVVDSINLQLTGPNSILLGSISDISIISDLEFAIDLKIPDADFMLGLADSRSRIIRTELINSQQNTSIGTGPWQITDEGNRGVYKFEKNPFYFDKYLPYADNLNLHIIPDEITRQTAFVVGSLDAIHLNDSQIREFESNFEKREYLRVPETGIGMEISLNPNKPPFDDINVRKAFYLAADPLSYINEIWPEAGYISLGIPLIHADWITTTQDTSKYFADITKSKELLKGVDIDTFTIKVGQFGEGYIEYAKRLQENLSNVGLQSNIEQVSRVDYVDNVWKDANYDVFLGPAPYVNSPNIYLFSVVHSGGLWHHGNPSSKQLDVLIEEQSGEYDKSKRKLQYQEIQNLIWKSYTRFMPVTVSSTWLVNDWLENFYPTLAGFEYNYLSEAWLNMEP